MSFASDLAHLWRNRDFRVLTWVRVLSQGGDGAFQVGIATAFFFDPTQATTPADIAAGFATLLAPFTLVGPFVGPLIDRWHRQRIVAVGNVVRIGLVVAIGASIVFGAPKPVLYALALATLSVNRFLLAALTAGIPRIVDRHDLLAANAIMPTMGTIAATAGAAVGGLVTFLVPGVSDNRLALLALASSGLLLAGSSLTATLLSRTSLGPLVTGSSASLTGHAVHLVRELRAGLAHLAARRTPLQALAVMAAARLLYGVMFVAAILISREVLGDPADATSAVANFTLVLGFAAVGFGLAAVLAPVLAPRVGRHEWILLCLVLGAAGQALLVVSPAPWALLGAAVVVSFSVQGGKIAVDTIVQRDTADTYRGRAFALYDVAYNTAFISAAVVAAVVLPPNGYSRVVMGALVAAYLVVALLYSLAPKQPRTVTTEPQSSGS